MSRCTCGHAFSSHQDPDDKYNPFAQRCKTCGCAAYFDRMEARMQTDWDDDEATEAAAPEASREVTDGG